MFPTRPLVTWLTLGSIWISTSAAWAQDPIVTDDMKKKVLAEKKAEDGWTISAKVGASFALNHNANVVGTDDGLTLQLGGVLSAKANLLEGQHGWDNELSLQVAQTRTPQLERFVKSLDLLDLTSVYTYRFESIDWLGLYGQALFTTQILEGEFVATDPVEVRRPAPGVTSGFTRDPASTVPYQGAGQLDLAQGESVGLTSPFEPFTMRQTIGLFADPVRSKPFNLSAKLGLGAQEILTGGGDLVAGEFADATGRVVVVRALEDSVVEAGIEAQVGVNGELIEEVLTYFAVLNAFYPPITTSDVDRSFGEAINLRLKAGASLKLTKYLSIEYVLTVLRTPAVTEDYQVQNGLLISAGFDLL